MKNLIDQSHRVDLAGINSLIRVGSDISHLVYMLCKDTRGMKVRDNNMPIKRKKRIFKLISLACLPVDMEFHDHLNYIKKCRINQKMVKL